MNLDIIEAWPEEGTTLRLRFENGEERRVDIASIVQFDGVFETVRDPAVFRQVRVDRELGTVVWPTGADLCPDVLYEQSEPAGELRASRPGVATPG